VIVTWAWDAEFMTLVAFTVTVAGAFTSGAVNRPVAEILPALEVQVTAGLLALLTSAPNRIAPPDRTVGVAGVITIDAEVGVGAGAGCVELFASKLLQAEAAKVHAKINVT
jgi:hypothetical protein